MLLCCNLGLFLGLLFYSFGLFVSTVWVPHCLHYFVLKLGHDIVSFIYLWILFVEMCDFIFFCTVCFQYIGKILYLTSHSISYFFKRRAMFSRSFCLTICTSNPFLLISALYSNYWVNSNLLYHTSTSFYSFWSSIECLLRQALLHVLKDKALLDLFYLFSYKKYFI